MRGDKDGQDCLFFTIDVESRIRKDHPLRAIKSLGDSVVKELDDQFGQIKGVRHLFGGLGKHARPYDLC